MPLSLRQMGSKILTKRQKVIKSSKFEKTETKKLKTEKEKEKHGEWKRKNCKEKKELAKHS